MGLVQVTSTIFQRIAFCGTNWREEGRYGITGILGRSLLTQLARDESLCSDVNPVIAHVNLISNWNLIRKETCGRICQLQHF